MLIISLTGWDVKAKFLLHKKLRNSVILLGKNVGHAIYGVVCYVSMTSIQTPGTNPGYFPSLKAG